MCKFSFLYGNVQIYIFVHVCTNNKAPQTPNISPAAPAGLGQLGRRPKQCLKMEPRQVPKGPPLSDKKLVSWKEIAAYLGREVRTVQRWENTEGLPVHRHEHLKKSTVYAYASELDEWFRKRQPKDDPEADAAFVPESDVDPPFEKE